MELLARNISCQSQRDNGTTYDDGTVSVVPNLKLGTDLRISSSKLELENDEAARQNGSCEHGGRVDIHTRGKPQATFCRHLSQGEGRATSISPFSEDERIQK